MGCLEGDVIGRRLPELFPREFSDRIGLAVGEVLAGRRADFEAEQPRTSQSPIVWNCNLVPVSDRCGTVNRFVAIFTDISDHARARILLRESEERYSNLFENAHDMIQSVGPDGRFIFVNSAWHNILGYSPEELPKLTVFDILCKDVLGHCSEVFRQVMEGTPVDNLETVFIARDGRRVYVEGNVNARMADGVVVATQGIFRDVTRRKQAEEELMVQASLLELSADAVLLLRLDATFIYFNQALMRMTGFTREELLQRKLHGIEPPDFADRIRSNIAMLVEKGQAVFESAYVCKDGSILPVEVHAVFTEVSGEKVIMSVVRDIRERKRAEEEVFAAEKKFRDLLDSIHLIAVILDRTGSIVYCNDYLLNHTGWSRDEVISRNWFELLIPATQRAEVQSVYNAIIADDSLPLHFEYQILARNGELRHVVWDNTVLHKADGTVVGTASIGNDVTEYRRLEEQFRHSQKMQAIGQLAGGVAHDFNNILTAIIGYSHLLILNMKTDDPLKINVEQILQASDRATNLTQSLLAFSRKQLLTPKPHDLNIVVAELQKFLLRLIRENISLSISSDGSDLTVYADRPQLEQVLMNLVANAGDAMPQGGSISLRTEHFHMDQRFIDTYGFGREGAYALITVADTGTGMDAETKERIFEPFFTTKDQGKGTGLGLSMAYGIVTQHEGFINVETRPGSGSVFSIYLPLFSGKVGHEPQTQEKELIPGGTETVLVAEDDAAIRKLISRILGNYGYKVVEAVDGRDAVAKYAEFGSGVDLLLLDGIMPWKSGRDVYREVLLINPKARAVFMTGYSEDIMNREGLLEPGIDVIQKPLTPSALLKKVRQALDSRA